MFKPQNEKLLKRIYQFICLVFILPGIILFGMLLFFTLPSYRGDFYASLSLKSLVVKRNEFGVPSIESDSFQDSFYALGVVHAQDRLWAMESLRRFGNGRLSEILGKPGLAIDKFFRNLSLRRYAQYSLDNLDEETKHILEVYSQGVNDYVKSSLILPFEFWYSWCEFEPWTPTDSLLLAKYYSLFVASDWNYELLHHELNDLFGEDIAREISPYTSELSLWSHVVTINDEELKQTSQFKKYSEGDLIQDDINYHPEPERNPKYFSSTNQTLYEANKVELNDDELNIAEQELKKLNKESQAGSNTWAVHGKLTHSGKPMLANDPHMETKIPSAFMQTQIVYGDEYISGVSMPGIPAIFAGKTKHIAWGIASAAIDTADIYLIEVDNGKYLYEDEWIPMKSFEETISVTIGDPIKIRIFETHHGIVLDYFLKDIFLRRNFPLPLEKKIVLAWTGYVHKETTITALNSLARAKNSNEIISSQKETILPSLAVTFVTQEDIGFLPIGRIPIRRDPRSGIKPKDGSKKENDWLGFVPIDKFPKIVNPEKGYIFYCNNKITTDNSLYHLSINQVSTARAARASEVLEGWRKSGKKITIEDMKNLQLDTIDVGAREFAPLLISYLRKGISREFYHFKKLSKNTAIDFIQMLEKWDYNTTKNSIEASIYNVWTKRYFSFFLEESSLSLSSRLAILGSQRSDHFLYGRIKSWQGKDKNHNFRDYWCVNKENTRDYACLATLVRAFEESLNYLSEKIHLKSEKWEWGSVHLWNYRHYPFSSSSLKLIFQKTIQNGGNERTLFTAGMDSGSMNVIWSPAFRMIVSMEENEESLLIIETGISGQKISWHYSDQFKIYHEMQYLALPKGRQSEENTKLLIFKNSSHNQQDL